MFARHLMLTKFESELGGIASGHRYPKAFVNEKTERFERLKIAASENGSQSLGRLASVLSEPFAILYILVVPRGQSSSGRYQSPWIDRAGLSMLFGRYGKFWDEDGRHHIWLRSDVDQATLVYDRHGIIYAYGPLPKFRELLALDGFSEADALSVPTPHIHHYHAEFDADERSLTGNLEWVKSPLREADSE